MEAMIRLCGCTSKSSLDAYDILLLLLLLLLLFVLRLRLLCCIYNKRKNLQREGEEREKTDVIPFLTKVVIPALPK